jgi:hypothetical protein
MRIPRKNSKDRAVYPQSCLRLWIKNSHKCNVTESPKMRGYLFP